MDQPVVFLLNTWIKFFFLFTPFFALSLFLSMTEAYSEGKRRRCALAVSSSTATVCLVLLFAGNQLFSVFGITLDAFRIGAGVLLFLSAINLVQERMPSPPVDTDIAVVPLTIPVIVGPATTGTLLVMGADLDKLAARFLGSAALMLAVATLGLTLLCGSLIQRTLGHRGLTILSKITGLILAALAAQMVMTGVSGFLG